MLKMSSRCVGAAFFGIVTAFVSGLCFGLRAWWPAGTFLVLAVACLCWCSRGAIFIDTVLTKFNVPLEGVYDTNEILKKVERAQEVYPSNPPKPVSRRRRWREGKDQIN